jgi:N-acyl-D-aspartate/D-glutamate deacylase
LKERCHPRHYSSYPSFFRKFIREMAIMRLEEGVSKCTSFPAQRFSLLDRGLLRPGMRGNVTVFNPSTIIDKAKVIGVSNQLFPL